MGTDWRQSLQIAFTYIGTVVGAGFASGREILEFFVRFGIRGWFGITLASLLFIWGGVRVMIVARRIQAHSYQEMNMYVFGNRFAPVFNFILATVLMGTTSVMLAATGSLFAQTLHLPAQAGIWLSMAGIYLVTIRGLSAIHSVNSVIVPFLIAFTLLVFAHVKPWEAHPLAALPGTPSAWSWISASVTYAALNVTLTQAVLVPIGSASTNERTLVWGGVLGGVGIGALLLLAYTAIAAQMPQSGYADMPMIYLMSGFGHGITLAFALLIYAEVFSTLVANVFGLVQQLKVRTSLPVPLLTGAVLGLAYAISFVGFASLLSLLYPLFGQIVVLFLLMLAYRELRPRLPIS